MSTDKTSLNIATIGLAGAAATSTMDKLCRDMLARLDRTPVWQQLFHGTISRHDYLIYLASSYHYVRWTRPLLLRASQRLVGCPLGRLLRTKAEEEHHHDDWLMSDFLHLGGNMQMLSDEAALPAVRSLIAHLRYVVEQSEKPQGLLGWAYLLEWLAVSRARQAVENLLQRGRIKGIERAVSFLHGHGDEDVDHLRQLRALFGSMVDFGASGAAIRTASYSAQLYPDIFPGSDEVAPTLMAA